MNGNSVSANEFGNLLKHYRLRAGFGTREFAQWIEEPLVKYRKVEDGIALPYAGAKLEFVCDALGMPSSSPDRDLLRMVSARWLRRGKQK